MSHQDSIVALACSMRTSQKLLKILISQLAAQFIVFSDYETEILRNLHKSYKGHRNGIIAMAYSPSLKMIVSAGIRDELFVWNPFVEKVCVCMYVIVYACALVYIYVYVYTCGYGGICNEIFGWDPLIETMCVCM